MSEYLKIIDKYEYISFDIFDTLIKRNLFKPTDLFDIVQQKYECLTKEKLTDWKNIRITAERKARLESHEEEITLDDIYKNIDKTIKNIERIKEIEIDTELELCEINNQIYELYDYCKKQNKKIIITSDMYLPKDVIEKILQKNKITYYQLFLSSEIKKTKRTGNLYKYVLEKLQINKNQIIHIGDNKKSDYIQPRKLGIKAINIKEINTLQYRNNKDIKDIDKFNYECLEAFLNNYIDTSKDYYWKTGYETFGPLLYGYVRWLNSNFDAENNKKIYFLSRDGYIMQKAFNIVYPEKETCYIYASRRALLVPTIWMYKNLQEILANMLLPKEITVKAFLKKLGLEPTKYKDIIEKYNYDFDFKIKKEQLENGKLEFYKEIEKDIYENSKREYENLLNYYKKIDFNGNVAIVDIGWYGNMQHALEQIKKIANWDVDIYGYYVGIVPESEKQNIYNMKGFLFDKDRSDLFLKKKFFNAIFETIFLAHHGSVKNYIENADSISLYPYEYQDKKTNSDIYNFQEGALQFIKDFSQSNISKYLKINENVAIYNLLQLGNRPTNKDINNFGNMEFYDDDYCKIIEKKSLLYYIFHLKKFKYDLEKSKWKTGFLKSILKIDLPYYEILIKIRKRIKTNE